MGNREALLAGARRCLLEKGYARTTARDIATTAGVSLAAIGYHFGTKEALLNEALRQALEEWGDNVEQARSADPGAGPTDRFETTWDEMVRSFTENRPLWAIQFELLAQIDRNPELRRTFAEANRAARLGLVEMFGLPTPPDHKEKMGAFLHVLLAGAAAQSLLDPEAVPTGRDMRQSIADLTTALGPGQAHPIGR